MHSEESSLPYRPSLQVVYTTRDGHWRIVRHWLAGAVAAYSIEEYQQPDPVGAPQWATCFWRPGVAGYNTLAAAVQALRRHLQAGE